MNKESESIISNPEKFTEIKSNLIKGGFGNIHIVADFDKTLTKAFVEGESIPSLISILRSENYLTPDYSDKANALYKKYSPMENDPNLTFEQRKTAMQEWWQIHFELLIKSGLNRKDIESAIKSKKIQLRVGTKEFIEILQKKAIPLVIISAAGLGIDSISLFFEREKISLDNIYIISNQYVWDKKGGATDIKKPIIHTLNKDETVLDQFPFYKKIEKRQNVILLGDGLDDIGMIKGFEYKNLLKIGFLNKDIDEKLPAYQGIYDVVITDDGSFNFINKVLEEILH